MIVPEGSVNSTDSLVIPLTTVIKKLRYDSRFNASAVLLIIIVSVFPYVMSSLKNRHSYDHMQIWVWNGILYMIVAYVVIGKMRQAQKTLRLYENGTPDVMVLNSQGFEFPVALLIGDRIRQDILDTGRRTIKLAWEDIASWHIFRQTKASPACHALTIKNAIPTPAGDYVHIDYLQLSRNFSKEEEGLLLDFAQRFLPVKIKKSSIF